MPLVKRRRDGGDEPSAKRPKAQSSSKHYRVLDKLGYQEDRYHTIYRSIPEETDRLSNILAKVVGSLLNTAGGIVCFGARPSGTVYGDFISRREEDQLKLTIDDVFKKFRPMVKTSQYRVTFTPVDSCQEAHRVVLEIRVQAGSHGELYEDMNHEAYLRRDAMPYGPLTPHEIKKHTVQQLRQRLRDEHSLGLLVQSPATRSKTRALLRAQTDLNRSAENRKVKEHTHATKNPTSVTTAPPQSLKSTPLPSNVKSVSSLARVERKATVVPGVPVNVSQARKETARETQVCPRKPTQEARDLPPKASSTALQIEGTGPVVSKQNCGPKTTRSSVNSVVTITRHPNSASIRSIVTRPPPPTNGSAAITRPPPPINGKSTVTRLAIKAPRDVSQQKASLPLRSTATLKLPPPPPPPPAYYLDPACAYSYPSSAYVTSAYSGAGGARQPYSAGYNPSHSYYYHS